MTKRTNLFIGIDDTDSRESKGTGYFSRILGHEIEKIGLGTIAGISRHQLLLDRSLDYTSHNYSSCIEVVPLAGTETIIAFLRDFIKKNATKGSQTGFCVASAEEIGRKVTDFGLNAKKKTVTTDMAFSIASENNIHIEGVTKRSRGVIGALAAIGLRATGDDGVMIWVKGREINEMKGIFHAGEIYCNTRVDCIKTAEGYKIPVNATIEWQNDARPVIMENFVTLLVEEHPEKEKCEWRVVAL